MGPFARRTTLSEHALSVKASDKPARCARCLVVYDGVRWRDLVLVQTLRSEDVAAHMTAWPWSSDAVVEVRRCSCGSTVARAVSAQDPMTM